ILNDSPKTAAQKPSATSASRKNFPLPPERSCRRRLSALRHFGVVMVPSEGWGRSLEDGIHLPLDDAAGELEEQLLEVLVSPLEPLPDFRHRPAGEDLPAGDDPDPVAHLLDGVEGVSAHQHGTALFHEGAEQLLQELLALGIE